MSLPRTAEPETAALPLRGPVARTLDLVLGLAAVSLVPLGLTLSAGRPTTAAALGPVLAPLGLVAVALHSLRQYLHHRGREVGAYLRGPDTGTRALRVGLEFLRLLLLEAVALVVDLLKVALGLGCFVAFVVDNLLAALGLFAACLTLALGLDRVSELLRGKLRRFYHFDGVVLSREPGPPRPAQAWARPTLGARLDATLERWLLPPVTLDAQVSIHLMESRVQLDRQAPCRVCGEALGEAPLVACGSCSTPHHRDCFEYLGRCAVYGCGGDAPRPVDG